MAVTVLDVERHDAEVISFYALGVTIHRDIIHFLDIVGMRLMVNERRWTGFVLGK